MRNTFKVLFITMVIGLFIMQPTSSYADWNGHNGNSSGQSSGNSSHSGSWSGHNGGWNGHNAGWHGHSYIGVNLSIWPDSYYYGSPYYPPADEVFVSSPVYQPVVEQPVTVIQPPVVVDSQLLPAPAEDSFTINIPNKNGGYTAVTLKRSGNGYIGPQGEFYPEFPKVSQLEVIYGK